MVAVIDLPALGREGATAPGRRSSPTPTRATARLGLVEGIAAAIDLLADYQQRYHRVVTSRLHSYLPATSLGVPVNFQPRTPGDVRFEGLHGMQPRRAGVQRDARRHPPPDRRDLRARLLGGASRDEVYAHWRELTAPQVAEAKAALPRAPAQPFQTDVDIAALVDAGPRRAQHACGPHDSVDPATVTDVAFSTRRELQAACCRSRSSPWSANATGPLRLWITGRGLDEDYQRWVGRRVPRRADHLPRLRRHRLRRHRRG